MPQASNTDHGGKISKTFANRLAQLKPEQEIRAIVLPVLSPASKPDQSMTRAARKEAAAAAVAAVMKAGFKKVDRQTSRTGGERITEAPNRLGYIHIKAPAATIYALAKQDWVKSIMEDQPIRAS